MKVSIPDIKSKMQSVLTAKGFGKEDIDFLIEVYLGGELRGHTSHGLASFPSFAKQDFSSVSDPELVKATNSVFIIDAKSSPAVIDDNC